MMTDCAAQQPQEDPRYCLARLKIIIDTLPVTILLNPVAVLLTVFAMWLGQTDFGLHSKTRIAAAVGAQIIASFAAFVVRERHRVIRPDGVAQARRELILMQGVIGSAWAAVGWALWIDGNGANNGLVAILLVMSLWALALTRCAVRMVFFTGIFTAVAPMIVRMGTSGDVLAHVFLALLPIVVGYVAFSGMAARSRVDEMLQARFALEDLSAELAAARDEAVEKRKEAENANASKSAFLANMSHELRTPLNAIIGFSEIIATQALGPHNERYPEYAGDIRNSGTHLLTLINEILDIAKIEAGKMEIAPRPLDPESALDAVERIMTIRCLENNLTAVYTVKPGTPMIMADERAFRQIVLNLVSNAVKFTPSGGRINITCEPAEEEGLLLSVSDTGQGIPAEKLAQLFQPFSQVDNRFDHHHGGTGLGLALVQGLAKLHHGRAWIESELAQGTTVYVYFPLGTVKQALTTAAE
ncbi:sensor histidine kinase [Rhizomicrobium palustre]